MSLKRQRSTGVEAWMQHTPLGFRFRPSDLEAFAYLFSKIYGKHLEKIPLELVQEFDVYVSEPSKLPRNEEDEFAYYFTERSPLSKNKINRYTRDGRGYWRISGTTWKTKAGKKNTLVYYIRSRDERGKGQKTNWIMHEYVLASRSSSSRRFVLCRIYNRKEHEEKEVFDMSSDGHQASDNELDWSGLLRMLGESHSVAEGDLFCEMEALLNSPTDDPSDTDASHVNKVQQNLTRNLTKQMDRISKSSRVEVNEENDIDLSLKLATMIE
ncbi:hypothetical protein ACET3Z_024153 [Daucus carota]